LLRRCWNCPKKKIVHNFLVTSPIVMKQSFKWSQIYNVSRQNTLKFDFAFSGGCLPTSISILVWDHLVKISWNLTIWIGRYKHSEGFYFKVLNVDLQFPMTSTVRPPFLELFCTMDFEFKIYCTQKLSWKSRKKFLINNAWFLFFKKLISRSTSKIEIKPNCY